MLCYMMALLRLIDTKLHYPVIVFRDELFRTYVLILPLGGTVVPNLPTKGKLGNNCVSMFFVTLDLELLNHETY